MKEDKTENWPFVTTFFCNHLCDETVDLYSVQVVLSYQSQLGLVAALNLSSLDVSKQVRVKHQVIVPNLTNELRSLSKSPQPLHATTATFSYQPASPLIC